MESSSNATLDQFCPCCQNSHDIVMNRTPDNQVKYSELIAEYKKLKKAKDGDITTLNFQACSHSAIQSDPAFKRMTKADRKVLLSMIPQEIDHSFSCSGCGIMTPINPGATMNIYTTYGTLEEKDYSRHIHNPTIPIIYPDSPCPKCGNDEALYFREDTTEQYGGVLIVLICTKCKSHRHIESE